MFLALELGRPLLLEGEAGVGKTELAKVLAATLGSRLIRLQCYEGLDVNTAVYEWNYPRQMLEIRLLEARGEIDKASAHDIFGPEFLLKRPLLQALEATDGSAPVLLIDEIDRADEEFEAYLLEILSDFQVTVPEIGTIRAAQAPRVVLTSNRTREVHDALKRRCLYHWIDYPTAAKEFEIVSTRVPDAPPRLAREVVGFVHRLRAADLTKVPGVAETLDWAAALLSLGRGGAVGPTWSTRPWASSSSTRRTSARCAARSPASTSPRRPRRPEPMSRPSPPSDPRSSSPTPARSIDGRRLLAEAVGFGRALRAAGPARRHGGLDRLRPGADARRHRQRGHRARRRRRRCSSAGATTARSTTACSTSSGAAAAGSCRRPASRASSPTPTARRRASPARPTRPARARGATMSELATMGVQVAADARGGRRDRGRDDLARRLVPGRGPPPPRLRPDDLGRAARRRAVRRPAAARGSSAAGPGGSSSTRTAGGSRRARCSARTWPPAS